MLGITGRFVRGIHPSTMDSPHKGPSNAGRDSTSQRLIPLTKGPVMRPVTELQVVVDTSDTGVTIFYPNNKQ